MLGQKTAGVVLLWAVCASQSLAQEIAQMQLGIVADTAVSAPFASIFVCHKTSPDLVVGHSPPSLCRGPVEAADTPFPIIQSP